MLQLRRWLRTAPPAQVVAAGLPIALMVVLVAASFRSTGRPGLAGSVVLGQAQASQARGALAGSPGVSSLGSGSNPGEPNGTSSDAGFGASASGASGATTSGASGTLQGPGAASGSAASSRGGVPAVTLTAADRGVSPTQIKIGFLNLNFGSVPGAQAAIGLRADIAKVDQAFVDDLNAHGGVDGRKVVAVQRSTDILDESDQNAACTAMVDDNKVFAISATAISATTATKCITIDGKTPMVNVLAPSEADQATAAGYDITLIRTIDRIYNEWAASLQGIGFLKPGDKIGVVADNCEPNLTVVNQVLIPALRKAGANVNVKVHDCAINASQQEMPAIVSYFASNGYTKILPADCPYAIVPFLDEAKAIHYFPKYSISDYCNSTADALAQLFDPTEFAGTLGITSTYTGGNGSSAPLTPEMQRCSKILTNAGLPGIDYKPANAEALAQCDYFTLIVKVLQMIGPNPTRAAFANAIGLVGDYRAGSTPLSTYRPGKYSGGELIHTIRFESTCRCYANASALRAGRF
ncbi:MAG: ABC transporter substrate-binding protein [Acidimicrobiales bacterium]